MDVLLYAYTVKWLPQSSQLTYPSPHVVTIYFWLSGLIFHFGTVEIQCVWTKMLPT